VDGFALNLASGCRLADVIDSCPLSQKLAGHMQNRKTKTKTNPSPDPNRYRRRCPNPNARIQKFIHYMAIATFAIADCHHVITCAKFYNDRLGGFDSIGGQNLPFTID